MLLSTRLEFGNLLLSWKASFLFMPVFVFPAIALLSMYYGTISSYQAESNTNGCWAICSVSFICLKRQTLGYHTYNDPLFSWVMDKVAFFEFIKAGCALQLSVYTIQIPLLLSFRSVFFLIRAEAYLPWKNSEKVIWYASMQENWLITAWAKNVKPSMQKTQS